MSARDVDDRLAEHTALVALLRALPPRTPWATVTERVLDCGSAQQAWSREDDAMLIPDPQRAQLLEDARHDVESWATEGWTMLSITDAQYPSRLKGIHQAPPFLFAKGEVLADDTAIAVVGSRKATQRGLRMADEIATELTHAGVTVLSGLAAGIDAAGHTAALREGGRTVAIIGTGISKYYPAANRELQDAIAEKGLLLSQFWPDAPPQKHTFLMRNAVMSGYGRATVVVDAGEHSGARAQARMAVEHGRPVILTRHVVDANEWAKALVSRPDVHVGASSSEIWEHIRHVLTRPTRFDQLLTDLHLTAAS